MNAVDRTFGWLLVIGSPLHIIESIEAYQAAPVTLRRDVYATR